MEKEKKSFKDDMPFVEYDGKKYYYDNGTEYIQVLEKIQNENYIKWLKEKGVM